ncbi:MAG: OmpP1/FadL family transporter [Deltaproteobacteria bacterium]
MRIVKGLAVLVILLLAAASANAGGFRLPEAGAKAMSMGFAFTAQANDPSAIYFNPAGIVQLEGQNVKAGMTYVKENGGTFDGTTPLSFGASISETQKDLDFFIPNLFWTRKASPKLAYGVGVFVPFGLGQEYKNRNTSYFRNQITKIDLMTIVLNPTVAYKFDDVLSVGAGIDFLYGKAELARTPVNLGIGDNTAGTNNLYNLDLEADGTAWGYNAGLLLTPGKTVKIGFNYRSKFSLDLKDGDVDLSNISTAPRTALGGFSLAQAGFGGATTYHTTGSATLNLPATAALGISGTFGGFTVEADADWTFWHSYRSLDINIPPVLVGGTTPVLGPSSSPKNWNDVVAFYLGAEYRVTDPLALRLGFRYDPTPVPAETMSPELPDADKLYYCAGAGYRISNWTVDLAYMYVDKKDRTVNNQSVPPISATGTPGTGFNGTWKGDAHLVALDLGYKF